MRGCLEFPFPDPPFYFNLLKPFWDSCTLYFTSWLSKSLGLTMPFERSFSIRSDSQSILHMHHWDHSENPQKFLFPFLASDKEIEIKNGSMLFLNFISIGYSSPQMKLEILTFHHYTHTKMFTKHFCINPCIMIIHTSQVPCLLSKSWTREGCPKSQNPESGIRKSGITCHYFTNTESKNYKTFIKANLRPN